jgi:predicted MFS family arabinose efflux permease
MLISSLSTVLANTYNLSTLKIGLVYLAPGAGSAIGAFVNGRVLDRDYQRIKTKHSGTSNSDKVDGNTTEEKLGDFPLERARLQSFPFLVTGYICSTIAYGFLVRYEVHIAGPIIFTFFSTYCQQGIMSTFGTMCVDYKPSKGASATSLNNIFKCLLGAAGTAVIQPMINGIGTGFTYLIVSAFVSLTIPIVITLLKKGGEWRTSRV